MIETVTVFLYFPCGGQRGLLAAALLQMQPAHTPISFPLLPDLLGTLAKPAESSYPFATNEKAGISLPLARGTVLPI